MRRCPHSISGAQLIKCEFRHRNFCFHSLSNASRCIHTGVHITFPATMLLLERSPLTLALFCGHLSFSNKNRELLHNIVGSNCMLISNNKDIPLSTIPVPSNANSTLKRFFADNTFLSEMLMVQCCHSWKDNFDTVETLFCFFFQNLFWIRLQAFSLLIERKIIHHDSILDRSD